MTRRFALLLVGAGVASEVAAQSRKVPFTQEDVLRLLGAKAPDATVAGEIRKHGIQFNPTPTVIKALRSRGLGDLAAAELARSRPAAAPKATPKPLELPSASPPDPNESVSREFWESMPSSPPGVTTMVVGDSGEVYAGTNGHGVYLLNPGTDRWKDITGELPNVTITAMVWAKYKNAKGSLVIATAPRPAPVNLFRWVDNKWTRIKLADNKDGPLDLVTCLWAAEPGAILIGCKSALFKLDLESEDWEYLALLFGYYVRGLHSAGESIFYGLEPITGSSPPDEYELKVALGLHRLAGHDGRRFDDGSLTDVVTAFALSEQGTFYAGTASNGVFASENNGISWKHSGELPRGRVTSLVVAKEGLYTAVKGAGVFMLPAGAGAWSQFSQQLTDPSAKVLVTNGPMLFVGTGGGVFRRRR
jgi:hypothetical protein